MAKLNVSNALRSGRSTLTDIKVWRLVVPEQEDKGVDHDA